MSEREFELDEGMITMDGYDDCIIGVCHRFGQEPIIAYDKDKVIAKLIEDGLDEESAEEWFEFNQIGAWWGVTTPCFITPGKLVRA